MRDESDLVISIGINRPKRDLIPSHTAESEGYQVLQALFTPLVGQDAEFRTHGLAAESVTSEDGRVWQVRLRPGYTFHDGEPVTADHYLAAWTWAVQPENKQDNAYLFERIASWRRLGELAFEVTLTSPYAGFPALLGHAAFFPLPSAAFDGPSLRPEFGRFPIGNGPFAMARPWSADEPIEMVRYPACPAASAKVAGLRFLQYRSLADQYRDLLSGDLDVQVTIPMDRVEHARAALGDRNRQTLVSTVYALAFPAHDPGSAAPALRLAIAMAIDRAEVSKTVSGGTQVPAYSFVPPVVPGHRPRTCGDAAVFDPVRARELYRRSGGVPGGILRFTYNADGAHGPWIEAIRAQLERHLGVRTRADTVDSFAEFLIRTQRHDAGLGLFRTAWAYDYPAMDSYLAPMFGTGGAANVTGYHNPLVDQLLAEAAAAEDQASAIARYQQIEDILAVDLPVIPLHFGLNNFGHSTRVRNVHIDMCKRIDLTAIEPAMSRIGAS